MSDIHLWLRHVRQEGLVVARAALVDEPCKQTAEDSERFKAACGDFWQIATQVLRWPDNRIARAETHLDACSLRLTELDVTLCADAALLDDDQRPTRLLVKLLGADDPDQRGTVPGWEAVTQQQAFERHLQESGICQGLLVTDEYIRLVYAPSGETPGYLEWPIEGMTTPAGRDMLAGLDLLLGANAIWGNEESRLDGILQRSREHQNTVSTALAEQVLGSLYTLLHGFTSQPETREPLRKLARCQPQQVYEGLLTVLLRMVFILYAEDRDLIPSSQSDDARALYDQGYSIRALFGQLEEAKAQYPDTMVDRYGAWGRLLGLFALIHSGTKRNFMHARRGKLFDPGMFPFLLGQFDGDTSAEVLPVPDSAVHQMLTQLLILKGERLSYKTLDVEQIGSVYETIMGFTVQQATGPSIALKVGTPAVPAFVDLGQVLDKPGKDRAKFILDQIGYKLTDAKADLVKSAGSIDDLLDALDSAIDTRACPAKRQVDEGAIILQPTDERRQSGSHYTPRALSGPIVRDALAPVLARLGEKPTPDQVLDLKVCDPAMGSGAFLVETCRVLGDHVQAAWINHPHLLPDEAREDPQTHARREVAKRCLFGVDRNAMATDLAKLSLWLVTLARDEDFSFLDHALKTGDSLVGLTAHQIKHITWDKAPEQGFMFAGAFDKAVAAAIRQRRDIRTAPDNVTF